jgi:hypothetical protein
MPFAEIVNVLQGVETQWIIYKLQMNGGHRRFLMTCGCVATYRYQLERQAKR